MTRAGLFDDTPDQASPKERARSYVRRVIAAAFCGVMLALGGCAGPQTTTSPVIAQPPAEVPEPAVPSGPPKAALLLPLSGDAAPIGEDMLNAAQMALFERGRSDLVLLPRDTAGNPATAESAARNAIAEGAELIIGPLYSTSTQSVASIAAENDLAVLSFSNNKAVAGGRVFVLGYRPEEQVRRVLDYARLAANTDIAALVPDDAYGALASTAWREFAAANPSVNGAAIGIYSSTGDDPSPVVRDLVNRHGRVTIDRLTNPSDPAVITTPVDNAVDTGAFDALLVADGGLRLSQIAALLDFYNVQPPATRLLGTERWLDDPTLLREPVVKGAWVAAPSPDNREIFRRRFADNFGRDPHPLAALAHDATALAVLLSGVDRTYPNDLLTDPAGFSGNTGIFRLTGDGTAEHGLAIIEIDPLGNSTTIDPSPSSFVTTPAN